MSKKYDELMNKIEVTEKMRRRILQNIQEAGIEKKPKAIRFWQRKCYLSIAACFTVVIVGILLVQNLVNRAPVQSKPSVDSTRDIEELASSEDLSAKVGFPVEGMSNIYFEANDVVYTSYWDELAQIEYCGNDGQTALYRKSIGTTEIDGVNVTLKGSGGNYCLAWWTDGTYAYSVCLSECVSKTAWVAMISNEN